MFNKLKYKHKWRKFLRWQKKLFTVTNGRGRGKYVWRPTGPGYLDYLDLLKYIEAFATNCGVYFWNFGRSLGSKNEMHEMWLLRKKVRSLSEWKIQIKWDKWKQAEIKKVFGDAELVNSFRDLPDGTYRRVLDYTGYDKNLVQKFYEENKSDIIKYYDVHREDIKCICDREDRMECSKTCTEKTEDLIGDYDIIEFLEIQLRIKEYENVAKETESTAKELGEFIFGSVHRIRYSQDPMLCGKEDDSDYKKDLAKYEALDDFEKRFSYCPYKNGWPRFYEWWD